MFRADAGDRAAIAARMTAISAERATTQPVKSSTGGSSFANPAGAAESVGWSDGDVDAVTCALASVVELPSFSSGGFTFKCVVSIALTDSTFASPDNVVGTGGLVCRCASLKLSDDLAFVCVNAVPSETDVWDTWISFAPGTGLCLPASVCRLFFGDVVGCVGDSEFKLSVFEF